ncbi:MAG: hypothetical protein ACK56I_36295, partial [bacterium]
PLALAREHGACPDAHGGNRSSSGCAIAGACSRTKWGFGSSPQDRGSQSLESTREIHERNPRAQSAPQDPRA